MGRLRILSILTAVVALVVVLASGCRDATQVTIDVSLTKSAKCTETKGTAITVGVDPAGTEDKVAHEYVTAATSACDETSGEIGTLVLTPSESGRASVIVVVAYDSDSAAACKPPLFKGCIVARRQFSFTDHKHLTMPITIDPNCKDVPCDAFSTCRTGKCFASEAACNGDTCTEPGDPGDGGTAVDGQVIPDTGVPMDGQVIPDTGVPMDGQVPDGAGPDGSPGDGATGDASEGGPDGSMPDSSMVDSGVPGGVYCDVDGNLICPAPTVCNSGNAGCLSAGVPVCELGVSSCNAGETQYCCAKANCPAGKFCLQIANQGGGPIPIPSRLVMVNPNPVGSTTPGTCQ